MKQNRKGFSLVELIVVLVIMAIIAALCAPNISAYVQAAKIQNYQTVANNLADELQTQLPQSRYWNWDEVQRNAEGILCSDAGRSVTPLESDDANVKKYQITGASSDANAVFTVTLTYQPADKTSQEVKVAVSCDGYAAAKAEQSCSLVLKTNYTDASAYPVVKKTITTTETNGWKQLDERVKTYDNWGKWLDENNNKQNDFRNDASFPDHYKGNNTLVINTTDYACNSVKFIQFQMPFYCFFAKKWYTPEGGTYGENLYGAYAFPNVDVNDGAGTGTQYDASKRDSNRENVYVYIGDDSDLDSLKYVGSGDNTDEVELAAHGWVRHDVIFSAYDGTFRSYADPYSDGAKAVAAFKAKYDITIQGTTPETASNDTNVIYRVFLKNPTSNAESSRGWIVVTGSNSLDDSRVVYMDPNQVSIYVDNGEVPEDCSALLYKQKTDNFYKHAEDGSQLYQQTLYFNITKCGYAVGDELVITLNNVHAKELLNLYQGTEAGWAFYLVSNVSESANETGSIQSIPCAYKEVDANSVQITIPLTWNMYPFLRLSFAGALSNVGADVSISLNRKSTTTTETDETQYTPMLTLNGDNTYTNITLDWTKCDYITDVSKVGIQFDKYPSGFSYDVYSKDYSLLASEQSLTKLMMGSSSKISASAAADQIIHLYCKDVSPDDISCSVIAPEAPVTTTTTTTVTSAETETETSAKTSDTAPETSASTESSTTTTTTTTITVTTTTTTTTAATTVTTSTTPTTASTSAASSSAAETTSATETTSASTSSTSASASSSETESTSETSVTTDNSDEFKLWLDGKDVTEQKIIEVPKNGTLEFETNKKLLEVKSSDAYFHNANKVDDTHFIIEGLVENNYDKKVVITYDDGIENTVTKEYVVHVVNYEMLSVKPSSQKLEYGSTVVLSANKEDVSYTIQSGDEYVTLDGNVVTAGTTDGEAVILASYKGKYGIEKATVKITVVEQIITGNVFEISDFEWNKEYDISDYFYVSDSGSRIPSEIRIHVSYVSDENTGFNVKADLTGDFYCQYNSYNTVNYSKNLSADSGDVKNDDATFSIYPGNDNAIQDLKNYEKTSFQNAKIKFYNYYQASNWNNIKIDSITFIYDNAVESMQRSNAINAYLPAAIETATTTITTTVPSQTTTTTTTTTTQPIAASENGKNVGLDESSAAGCNITFSESLFNDSGVCYFTITPKAGYALSDSYTVKVGTEVLSPKNNYNPKTNQWFFWSNKSMTDYTIHVEGISPAA